MFSQHLRYLCNIISLHCMVFGDHVCNAVLTQERTSKYKSLRARGPEKLYHLLRLFSLLQDKPFHL